MKTVNSNKPQTRINLEYIWLDGNKPQQIRSKNRIIDTDFFNLNDAIDSYRKEIKLIPKWNFDGSSTNQATTSKSELILIPVSIFFNPFLVNSIIVLCEVYNTDGTPHSSNTRKSMIDTVGEFDDESLYGYEQEFFIIDNYTKKPLGWPMENNSYPRPQGEYYCGVGANNIKGREFVEEHTKLCIEAGIKVSGTNAEVALGQWEYQVGTVLAIEGADQLWVSRYILYRLGEKYNYTIDIHPKPFKGGDWNGSGMHVNFSTKTLREDKANKRQIAEEMCNKLSKTHKKHIEIYGIDNEHRLTGKNETSSMKKFGWGIGDRTKSIRIPSSINDKDSVGYIEDRRPASNADPYLIVDRMLKTICGSEVLEKQR
jgi:glutamine synthetase